MLTTNYYFTISQAFCHIPSTCRSCIPTFMSHFFLKTAKLISQSDGLLEVTINVEKGICGQVYGMIQ